MSVDIMTEKNGRFTHYYIKHPSAYSLGNMYIGLSVPAERYDMSGKFGPSFTHTLINFSSVFFTADMSAFLPGQITVENELVMAFMSRAAEWYIAEYDLYRSRTDDEWIDDSDLEEGN